MFFVGDDDACVYCVQDECDDDDSYEQGNVGNLICIMPQCVDLKTRISGVFR